MSTEDNKRLVDTFYAAGARGDLETCLGMLAEDVRWINIGSTVFSGTFTGREELVDKLLGPLFGQLKAGISSDVENVIAEGDYVVVQSSGRAETAEGVPYNNAYCQIFRIRDGEIIQVKEYFDTELTSRVFGGRDTV